MRTVSTLLFGLTLYSSVVHAKVRIAVSEFVDKSSRGECAVRNWGSKLGSGFRDQITTALMDYSDKVSVVERENIKNMYNEEHELINADPNSLPQKNKFKAAHYSITGAVTAFEMCSAGAGGKVDVGGLFGFKNTGLNVGGKRTSAKVIIDIRVVNVTTGEVFQSFNSEGDASKVGFDMDGSYKGADFSSAAFKSSPIGEATRLAIQRAVKKIVGTLPNRKNISTSSAGVAGSFQPSRNLTNLKVESKDASPATQSVIKAASRHSHLCKISREYRACTIASVSDSGQLVKIIDKSDGKFSTLRLDQVVALVRVETPKMAGQYYVDAEAAGLCSLGPQYCKARFRECSLVDKLDGQFVMNCDGHEYLAGQTTFYQGLHINSRGTASEN